MKESPGFTRAIARKPGNDFDQGLTTSDLGLPDYNLMRAQHEAYVRALESVGLAVTVMESLPGCPDAYFVEDAAVVVPEVAVITRPGAPSRRGEVDSIELALARFRSTVRILPPATVDGGDVLMAGNHFLIGVSGRTNEKGVRQLGSLLEKHGYTWVPVRVGAGLHLKSGVNFLGQNTLLVTEAFAGDETCKGYRKIVVDKDEAYAANSLSVNGCLMVPRGFPKTRKKLEVLGMKIMELDVSEARRMDGGLTCMSLRF